MEKINSQKKVKKYKLKTKTLKAFISYYNLQPIIEYACDLIYKYTPCCKSIIVDYNKGIIDIRAQIYKESKISSLDLTKHYLNINYKLNLTPIINKRIDIHYEII